MRFLLLFICLSIAPALQAQEVELRAIDASRLYAEAHIGAGSVAHSNLRFNPLFASFSAGAFVLPGIGIEAFVDAPLDSDEDRVFDLSLSGAAGVALRLQSPPQRGLQGYVLLGYVDFGIEQTEESSLGTRTVNQSYTGARASIGIMQRLNVLPHVLFGAEYRIYHSEDAIQVDGWSLGWRVNMQ